MLAPHVAPLVVVTEGGGTAAARYQRTVKRFPPQMYAIPSHGDIANQLNIYNCQLSFGIKMRKDTSKPVRCFFLTCRGLKWREPAKGERLVLSRCRSELRALESAAAAAPIMEADKNGAVFTYSASSTAPTKLATFGLVTGRSFLDGIPRQSQHVRFRETVPF